jgi:GAF domain-containing protein
VASSLSLVLKDGPVTRAATSPLAMQGDQLQYDEGEGPCLDAAMHERWLYTADVATDERWPRSCERMHRELGVGSMFSCRLSLNAAPRQTLGGINLYATAPDAFSESDRMLAILLSSMAAVVVDASRQQAQLRAAIQSRQVIGEAIGILRYQSDLSSDEAFAVLTGASQRLNVKLREVARRVVQGTPAEERTRPT